MSLLASPPQPTHSEGAAWPRVAPFAAFIALLAVRPYLGQWLGPWGHWAYLLQTALSAGVLLACWPQLLELRGGQALDLRNVALAIAAGLGVFVAWINLDFFPLALGQAAGMPPPAMLSEAERVAWLAVRVAGAAILVPLIEELFWRSFLMRWLDARAFLQLDPAKVSLRALLLSSLVFGFEHSLWFAGLLAGLVYAWLYRRGQLWLPVIAHATTNLVLGVWVIYSGNWQFW